jgi:DnaJ-domain-containing protein 1
MVKNGFTKPTKEQRARMKARRSESRAMAQARLLTEIRLGCYLYLGGSDGELTPRESTFLRRECGATHNVTVPTRESLARKVRSFLLGCRPSLRDRRELLARLREFATCDGPISADEDDALKVIEDLLQVSSAARKAQKRPWGTAAARGATVEKSGTKKGSEFSTRGSWGKRRERVRVERPQPNRSHWSYEYLGCTEHDTDETIKQAYRQLAVKLHPDKHAARSSTPQETLSHLRAFQKLQEAYEAVLRLRSPRAIR